MLWGRGVCVVFGVAVILWYCIAQGGTVTERNLFSPNRSFSQNVQPPPEQQKADPPKVVVEGLLCIGPSFKAAVLRVPSKLAGGRQRIVVREGEKVGDLLLEEVGDGAIVLSKEGVRYVIELTKVTTPPRSAPVEGRRTKGVKRTPRKAVSKTHPRRRRK